MKVTPDGLTLLAARLGAASAKVVAHLTPRERLAAELQVQRALARSVEDTITSTHPLHRPPLRERLATIKARVRTLAAALKTNRGGSGPQGAGTDGDAG